MGLKVKSFYETMKDLIDWTTSRTKKITDFNVGSGIRTIYEAISFQFEEFYFRMKQNILYAITNSIYLSFDFERQAASNATGEVTLTFTQALPTSLTIPKGTIFMTSNAYGYISFETIQDYEVEQGYTSARVKVICKESGTIGNVPQGAISLMVPSNSIVKSVYNESSFSSGKNEETAIEHKQRFQKYISSLSRGTASAILYGALQVEGISSVWVDDSYIGYVKVYAVDSDGNLSDELKQALVDQLENYRAAGIEVEVFSIVKVPIDLNINVIIENEFSEATYADLIQRLVSDYLLGFNVGETLYVANLMHQIKSSYETVVVNTILGSYSDVTINSNELIYPGNVIVTCTKVSNWRAS